MLPGLLTAIVISVTDGDTLQANAGGRAVTIHLACIDAPEIGQAPYGTQAKNALTRMLPHGTPIKVTPHETDRKSQVTALIFVGGDNINLKMARTGNAFSTADRETQCETLRFLDAEANAKFQQLGIWAVAGGITPPGAYRMAKAVDNESPPVRPYKGPQHVNLGVITGSSSRQPSSGRISSRKASSEADTFSGKCEQIARQTYIRSSGGISPPSGMTREYCQCAFAALETGDTLTKSVEFCRTNVFRKYGIKS